VGLGAEIDNYEISVQPNELGPDASVKLTLLPDDGTARVADDDPVPNTYGVSVVRLQGPGTTVNFFNNNVTISGSEPAVAHIAAWDGIGAMQFVIGGEQQEVTNQYQEPES